LERLVSQATVLGLFEDCNCVFEEHQLFPADALVLYTDGVTESFNDTGEEFGEKRLIEVLRRNRGMSSQALIASVVDEVRRFSAHEQQDDITLIVANCRENAKALERHARIAD
jgi:sigma-B regulation protein RsbU (phosphoserine phosphatase)